MWALGRDSATIVQSVTASVSRALRVRLGVPGASSHPDRDTFMTARTSVVFGCGPQAFQSPFHVRMYRLAHEPL